MKLSHILEAKYAGNVVYIPTDETTNGDTTWCINCVDCLDDDPPGKKILAEVEAREKEVKRAYYQKQLDSL